MNILQVPELRERINAAMVAGGVGFDDIDHCDVVETEGGSGLVLYIHTHDDKWTGAFNLPAEVVALFRGTLH